MKMAALLLVLGMAACAGGELDDPCAELTSCVYEAIVGCADPAFGEECVELTVSSACGEMKRACDSYAASDPS